MLKFRSTRPPRRLRALLLVTALVGGVVSSGALVWHASYAAFVGSTENSGNSWTAGSVTLSDDDAGAALFDVTGLTPGSSTGSPHCITVTYSGDVPASVKLYSADATGDLAQYINLTIDQGTGGSFADCTGFVADAGGPIFTGTLQAFGTAHNDFANGVGTFEPTTNPSTKVYRFAYTLDAATPSTAQGDNATATFTWESQNT